MAQPRIAVVNSSSFGKVFSDHVSKLAEFSAVELIKVPADCTPKQLTETLLPFHGIVASVNPSFTAETLSQLPLLVAITRHGIGYNNVAVEAASRAGIIVTRVEGHIEQAAVAELSVSLLLSAARDIPTARVAVQESRWGERASFVGIEILNKKVAVIGLGNLGRRAADIVKNGFNAEILGVDPAFSDAEISEMGFIPCKHEEAFNQADIVLLHCSLNDGNYHLLNKETLLSLKDGAIVVNTARGELVDSVAMRDALLAGKVRTYAADVVEGEPIDGNHPLLEAPNALVVPHLGGYTDVSLRGMGDTMVNNMRSIFVDGVIPDNAINKDAVSKIKPWG